ncbi:MAG: hypothetical protein AVDCRST_MAG68-3362, partial [uncultured Gemmatimonadetes bacterium]
VGRYSGGRGDRRPGCRRSEFLRAPPAWLPNGVGVAPRACTSDEAVLVGSAAAPLFSSGGDRIGAVGRDDRSVAEPIRRRWGDLDADLGSHGGRVADRL